MFIPSAKKVKSRRNILWDVRRAREGCVHLCMYAHIYISSVTRSAGCVLAIYCFILLKGVVSSGISLK